MDIYLNLGTGAFAVHVDEEDNASDWKTRFMLVNAAWQRPWPRRSMRRFDKPRIYEGFEYDEMIELDCVELAVSSTLPTAATDKVLELVAAHMLSKLKSDNGDDAFYDEEEIDIEVSLEDVDGIDDGRSEEKEHSDE